MSLRRSDGRNVEHICAKERDSFASQTADTKNGCGGVLACPVLRRSRPEEWFYSCGGSAEAGISIANGGAALDVGWVCLAGWGSPIHPQRLRQTARLWRRAQAVVFAVRSWTGGLSPHPSYDERSAPDVGWVCLAGWGCLSSRGSCAKPPDSGGVRRSWCLPHAHGRAGCRHTHPTTAYLRASASALSSTSLRVTSAPPRRLLSSAASMKA